MNRINNINTENTRGLYNLLKSQVRTYSQLEIAQLLGSMHRERILEIAAVLSEYIRLNLPKAVFSRKYLTDYRTNPYVIMASANTLNLSDPNLFSKFLFYNKFYMGLETSFGKSIENLTIGYFPINEVGGTKWIDPPEKVAEKEKLSSFSKEEKARKRNISLWREIDKSCVVKNKRFLLTIKSGPNTINDTQVEAMKSAIASHSYDWMLQTKKTYPQVTELDIVIGLTYGTNKTTNNKDNQILVKLLENGFVEEDRKNKQGILIDNATKSIRVYRLIGQDFWAFIGNPTCPESTRFIYLEILFSLSKALTIGIEPILLTKKLNERIQLLSQAFQNIVFPYQSIPERFKNDFSEDQLFWITVAMTAFFDRGI